MPDPHLDALWQNVLASWDRDAAHGAFIEHARRTQQLGAAAARYREEIKGGSAYREDSERAALAEKRLAGIAMLAMLEIDAQRGASAPRMKVVSRIVSYTAAGLLFALAVFVTMRFVLR